MHDPSLSHRRQRFAGLRDLSPSPPCPPAYGSHPSCIEQQDDQPTIAVAIMLLPPLAPDRHRPAWHFALR